MTYDFTLIVEGEELQTDENLDVLYEAGCDDATIGRINGIQHAMFSREAASLEEAILSAIRDVEALKGARVVRVADAGLVSMADIAARTGRTRESVRLLVAGERGPGGFPPPVTAPDARYRLWSWSDVQRWLSDALGEPVQDAGDHVIEAINAGLELRRHARYLSKDGQMQVREIAADWNGDED